MTRSGGVNDSDITLIGLHERAAWEAATAQQGLPSQTWAYAWGLAAEGIEPQLAVVRASGAEMLLPFVERPIGGHVDVATLPGLSGALLRGDGDAPLATWSAFARRRGWVSGYIQLACANEQLTVAPPDTIRAHNAHFVFDMKSWDFRTSVGANMRRTLTAGERVGAQLVTDRDRLADAFPELYRQSMARAGDHGFGDEALARWFADPDAVAFGVEVSGVIEAAHLGRARGSAAELHLAGASDKGRHLQAWLIRRAAETLRASGVRYIDIGGYGRHGDGLHAMKRRLGIAELPMRSLRQVYDPKAFAELCAATGADPGASYFPPYRALAAEGSEAPAG